MLLAGREPSGFAQLLANVQGAGAGEVVPAQWWQHTGYPLWGDSPWGHGGCRGVTLDWAVLEAHTLLHPGRCFQMEGDCARSGGTPCPLPCSHIWRETADTAGFPEVRGGFSPGFTVLTHASFTALPADLAPRA